MTPRHPLIERLAAQAGACEVRPETVEAFERQPGTAVLFFAGDPARFPEALDVAVVLPELRAAAGGFAIGLVPSDVEDALARRYAVQRWPSLVWLRDGGYLGTSAGMKDWDDFLRDWQALRQARPGPRPRPAIAIQRAAACG
jgi:hydrogenase-1 operon protein HyaE